MQRLADVAPERHFGRICNRNCGLNLHNFRQGYSGAGLGRIWLDRCVGSLHLTSEMASQPCAWLNRQLLFSPRGNL